MSKFNKAGEQKVPVKFLVAGTWGDEPWEDLFDVEEGQVYYLSPRKAAFAVKYGKAVYWNESDKPDPDKEDVEPRKKEGIFRRLVDVATGETPEKDESSDDGSSSESSETPEKDESSEESDDGSSALE